MVIIDKRVDHFDFDNDGIHKVKYDGYNSYAPPADWVRAEDYATLVCYTSNLECRMAYMIDAIYEILKELKKREEEENG